MIPQQLTAKHSRLLPLSQQCIDHPRMNKDASWISVTSPAEENRCLLDLLTKSERMILPLPLQLNDNDLKFFPMSSGVFPFRTGTTHFQRIESTLHPSQTLSTSNNDNANNDPEIEPTTSSLVYPHSETETKTDPETEFVVVIPQRVRSSSLPTLPLPGYIVLLVSIFACLVCLVPVPVGATGLSPLSPSLVSLQPIFTSLCTELDLIVASTANETSASAYLATVHPFCIDNAECTAVMQQTVHEDQSFERFQNMAMQYIENATSVYRVYRDLLCTDPATEIRMAHVAESIGILNARMLAMHAAITPVCPPLQHFVIREDRVGRCVCHQDAICDAYYRRDTSILTICVTIGVVVILAMVYNCYTHRKIHNVLPQLRPVHAAFNRVSTGRWI